MSNFIAPGNAVKVTVDAGDKLATTSLAKYRVEQTLSFTNSPDTVETVFVGEGENVTAAFTDDTEVTIRAGQWGLYWDAGAEPVAGDPALVALSAARADPAAYSETASDIAAVLVALGVMEPDA